MIVLAIVGIALFFSFLLGYHLGYRRGAKEREQILEEVQKMQAENLGKIDEGKDLTAIWRNLALGRLQKPTK